MHLVSLKYLQIKIYTLIKVKQVEKNEQLKYNQTICRDLYVEMYIVFRMFRCANPNSRMKFNQTERNYLRPYKKLLRFGRFFVIRGIVAASISELCLIVGFKFVSYLEYDTYR